MSEQRVTLSYEDAAELYRRLQAYDSTLDLGFGDKASNAFEALRRELERCHKAELMKGVQELSDRAKEQK